MSHRQDSSEAPWADRVAQRRNERQLQLGLDEHLPATATLPSWEGLPDQQRVAVIATLARLLAKAGLIRVPGLDEAAPASPLVEQRCA